jgi:hypothetical protein
MAVLNLPPIQSSSANSIQTRDKSLDLTVPIRYKLERYSPCVELEIISACPTGTVRKEPNTVSAAQLAPQEAAAFFHDADARPDWDRALLEMTHDLRQPLSTIEAIAYYLEMTIPAELLEARTMLARVQQLLELADGILDRAEQDTRVQLPV